MFSKWSRNVIFKMIESLVRAAAAAAVIVTLAAASAIGAEPSPFSSPTPSYLPMAAPSPTIDPGWMPEPGTAAYDPSQPRPEPSPAPQARATTSSGQARSAMDGRIGDGLRMQLTPGERAYELTRDDSYLDPRSWDVSAFKSRHQLVVYYKGRLYRTYRAVFGRNRGTGTKLFEGDRRTPEGVYTIIEKHPSRRWRWFLGLNYPNEVDRSRYEQLRDARAVPVRDGHEVGEGGHIGIHGTDIPVLNDGNIDWTTGCISVNNRDIDELARILPVGTVVIIKP